MTECEITIQIRQLCKLDELLSDKFSMMAWPKVCSLTVFLIQSMFLDIASGWGKETKATMFTSNHKLLRGYLRAISFFKNTPDIGIKGDCNMTRFV